jgi:hypothetical protein
MRSAPVHPQVENLFPWGIHFDNETMVTHACSVLMRFSSSLSTRWALFGEPPSSGHLGCVACGRSDETGKRLADSGRAGTELSGACAITAPALGHNRS